MVASQIPLLQLNGLFEQSYLLRADTDGLFADDPGNALQQRGCGQRAIICPIVQATREQGSRVEVSESGLLALKTRKDVKESEEQVSQITHFQSNAGKYACQGNILWP